MVKAKIQKFHFVWKDLKRFGLIFIIYSLLLWGVLRLLPVKEWLLTTDTMLPWWCGGLFILAYIIRGFFYFPTLYFLIAASLIFPILPAFAFYMIAIMSSGLLSYQIGLTLREKKIWPGLQKKLEHSDIDEEIQAHGFKAVFIFHATGISLDLPNYFSGYLKLNRVRFLWTIFWANLITGGLYFVVIYIFDVKVLIGKLL